MNSPTSSQRRFNDNSEACLPGGPQSLILANMQFDGTGAIVYTFDGAQVSFAAPTSGIRSLYFDARSLTVGDALLAIQGGETLRIPFGKQGYLPMFAAWPVVLTISSAQGNGPLTLELFNFKIAPIIW